MKNQKTSRRDFLRRAGIGSLFLGVTSFSGLKAAALAAQHSDKPVLTQRNLNRYAARLCRKPRVLAQEVQQAQTNLLGYLTEHFTLTEEQQAKVKTMPPAAKKRLNQALDEAVAFNRENLLALRANEALESTPPADSSAMLFILDPIPDVEIEIETDTTTTTTTTTHPDGTTTTTTITVKKVRRKDKVD
ncbi:MAG: hypothetical protein D6722_09600 [Bacteroidetes bacterium]|nr:MAG: hypothetical protein D6722_09600 [Bacteroidota bacterium]